MSTADQGRQRLLPVFECDHCGHHTSRKDGGAVDRCGYCGSGRRQKLRVLSLFAGIGGIDLGLERAGMQVVAHAEIDPYASRVLAKHWPDVPNLGDVTAWDWTARAPLGDDIGRIDVIAGGFPCQPFSSAGLRRGLADERWMWPEFARAIRALRPRYVIVENVPDLARDRDAFGWVLGDLADLGFDAEWGLLSACSMGAPHTRSRLFIVAHAHGGDGEAWMGLGAEGSRPVPRFDHRARSPHDTERWFLEAAGAQPGEADGIPARLDGNGDWNARLRCLGNAVVPQVAEWIGRQIVALEDGSRMAA